MSTAGRNTPRSRACKLAALSSKESCQGKSKFFLEHQALWEKEGNRGYDTNVHRWRYAKQLPLPEGRWPNLSVLCRITRRPRDEHEKEEAAKWHRMENGLQREEERQQKLIEEELRRQQGRLASQRERFASGQNNLPSRGDKGHISNVQMAVQFINRKSPGSKYELKEKTAKSRIFDFGSDHWHYNFSAYSPTDGVKLFFAEVDVSIEREVVQCCEIGSRACKLLAALNSKESCQGKSKYFLEHQALREKEGNKGYDTNVHGWRYANQLPLPEGEWPDLTRVSRRPRDELEKEQAAKWHRMENRLQREEERQEKLIEDELRRQQRRLASQRQRFASGRNNLPSRDDKGHVSNVQMAVQFVNRKNPGSKYELKEITAKSRIFDCGSDHWHYNFAAYSPTDGIKLFFAEVDVSIEHEVLQCCEIEPGTHGCCMGCQNQGVLLIHPSCDQFFAGQESFCTDSEWCC